MNQERKQITLTTLMLSVKSKWSFMLLLIMMLLPHASWAAGTQPSGAGTSSSDPYLIDTADKLIWFRDKVNNTTTTITTKRYYAKLTDDIDLGNVDWTPIGKDYSCAFGGQFDGNGKTISGLNITYKGGTTKYCGLFGYTSATITNFTLKGDISVQTYNGNVGTVAGCMVMYSTISDVRSEVNITVTSTYVPSYLGGIVGCVSRSGIGSSTIYTAEVKGCIYTGTIKCAHSQDAVGGIVGGIYYNSATTGTGNDHGISITKCIFNGAITRDNSSNTPTYVGIGGILGSAKTDGEVTIKDNLSLGTITYDSSNPYLEPYAAAIIGSPDGTNFTTTNITGNYSMSRAGNKLFGNNMDSSLKLNDNNYMMNVSADDTGYGTVTYSADPITSSTDIKVNLKASPKSNCGFIGWSDGVMTAERTITVSPNINLVAKFGKLEGKAVYNNKTLTFYYDAIQHEGTTYLVDVSYSGEIWKDIISGVQTVVFDRSFKGFTLSSCANWFMGASNLTSISGFEYLPSSTVTNMFGMFSGCSSLKSLDLSNLNTASVKNANGMFSGCSSLESITFADSFLPNVTSISAIFQNCNSLTSLDLSKFNTANVTNMSNMFYNCSSLTSLDLSKFNTANVTGMSYMFRDCSSLTSLDLSKFNMAKVTNTDCMFYGCYNLQSITIPSSVTSIGEWAFGSCRNLASITIPSSVTSIGELAFRGCAVLRSKLTNSSTLNLEEYSLKLCDTEQPDGLLIKDNKVVLCRPNATDVAIPSSVTSIGYEAFYQCGNLQSIVIPSSVRSIEERAFFKCSKLSEFKLNSIPSFGTQAFNGPANNKDFSGTLTLTLSDGSYIETGSNMYFPPLTSAPTYSRTDIKNQWGTIVMPFSVTIIDSESQPYDFYKVTSVTDEELQLTKMDGILAAGTPALIRMSGAAKNAETGKYNLNLTANSKAVNTTISNPEAVNNLTLSGTYANTEVTEGYIISNNAFWNVASLKETDALWKNSEGATIPADERKVYSAPFHAYLTGSAASGAKQLSIGLCDENVTAVEALNALSSEEGWGEIYDLNGQRLSDLQKGINIVKRGGKSYKVIIK